MRKLAKKRVRRTWSDEEKRSICLQTLAPGVSVSQVARRYAMNANQIFNWLKDERFAPSPDETDTAVFPLYFCQLKFAVSRIRFLLFWNRARLVDRMAV